MMDEAGAVTVDWAVLGAIAAGFGVIVLLTLTQGTTDVAQDVAVVLDGVGVTQIGALGTGP